MTLKSQLIPFKSCVNVDVKIVLRIAYFRVLIRGIYLNSSFLGVSCIPRSLIELFILYYLLLSDVSMCLYTTRFQRSIFWLIL